MLYVLYLHFAHVFLVVKDLHPETEHFDFYLIDYWLIERVKGRTFAKLKSIYESYSDVGESRVWFASKNLTPCRMH